MSAARSDEGRRRFRPAWCVLVSAICLAPILAGALAVRRSRSLQQAEAEARQEAACEAVVAREDQVGRRALAIGDRAGAASHFREVNRWSAQADRHMRARSLALRYWW